MRIVIVNADRGRDERKTRDHLHKLGVPYATAKIPTTVRVERGDQIQEWTGYLPHLIRKHCPLNPA